MRAALLLALLCGCAVNPPASPPVYLPGNYECWSKNISSGAGEWLIEARKRFGPAAFVFVCHGDTTGPAWMLVPDHPRRSRTVEQQAWDLHLAMPDRDIVMVVCNEDGRGKLNVPNVWYANGVVWSRAPTTKPGNLVADIYSFVTAAK
jgi:hypothetical protein